MAGANHESSDGNDHSDRVLHPVRIAPSLLASDFARLADEIARAEAGGADWLHVDVMDGHFVPNITMGPMVVESIARVATRPLDVHLMVTDPWTYADRYLDAGAAGITFHVEVVGSDGGRPQERSIDEGCELLRSIRARGGRAGITLNPDTPPERLLQLLPYADMVLVMSVFPGFGGQRFMPEVLDTVRWLAKKPNGWQGEIEIDGGIGTDTIESAAAAGANVFVAGTAVFGGSNVAERIRDLRVAAQAGRTR